MTSVSFVVPFYNKARYVDLVLDAIAAQTGIDEPEYIFVDDGSTDDTLARLERRRSSFAGARVIHIANAGPSVAANKGLAEVTKEFVKMVDGDDILHPAATRCLVEACRAKGTAVAFGDLVHYDLALAERDGGFGGFADLATPASRRIDDPLQRLVKEWQLNPTQHLFRAELLRKISGCDARVFIQDFSLALRLASCSPFAQVESPVAAVPSGDASRMTANEAQILHDINLATAYFVAESAALSNDLKKRFLGRAWGRAWKWASRRAGTSVFSSTFRDFARAEMRLLAPTFQAFERACLPFRKTHPIRIPEGDRTKVADA
ncbi:MAG: glycosyltransferase family 2 protein [Rhodospirillales bacterium]|nr:glycosyltransferase family 2 protein [Rhodospirillales bacterium]